MRMQSDGKVVVTEVRNGLKTSHYRDMHEALLGILTMNGPGFFEKFKTDVLPKVEREWADEASQQAQIERHAPTERPHA